MFCTQCGGTLADDAKFCVRLRRAPVGPRVASAPGASAQPATPVEFETRHQKATVA